MKINNEEIKKVSGGTENRYYDCPKCFNKSLVLDHNDSLRGRDYFYCMRCGRKLTYIWEGARWIEGWVD